MTSDKKSDEARVVLYRKYRPQNFNEVRGQDQVVKVLEGSIKQKNIAHAYLFSGSRGTGKTSVARIFAREVGTSLKDLYEIDAASHTGVDNIRELREAVGVLPFESPYKVYIIDEVHMLSKAAFNALLKTLEEPPAHVLFVLATTELEKVPETVISRCQSFTFKKPPQVVVQSMVADVAKKEGYILEQSSADLIALLSEGSFRDALGILQKIIVSSDDKKISVKEVETVTGAPPSQLVNQVIEGIEEKNTDKVLIAVGKVVEQGADIGAFMKLLLHKVRAILLLRFAKDLQQTIKEQFSEEDLKLLSSFAEKKNSQITVETLQRLLEAATQLPRAHIRQLPLELALIDIIKVED